MAAKKGGTTKQRHDSAARPFQDEQRIFYAQKQRYRMVHAQRRGGKPMTNCPECGGNVPAEAVERGEILPCPDCGAQLEVRELAPLTLTLAPEIQEDWGE